MFARFVIFLLHCFVHLTIVFFVCRLKVQEHVQHVEIGEFMDILCPQHSLMEIVGGPREPAVFDLYNVTKSEYDHCQLRGELTSPKFATSLSRYVWGNLMGWAVKS